MSKMSNFAIDVENKMSDPLFILIFNRIVDNIKKGNSKLTINQAYIEATFEYNEAVDNS